MSSRALTADAELGKLQHDSFSYFLHETNPVNGMIIDKTAEEAGPGTRVRRAGCIG